MVAISNSIAALITILPALSSAWTVSVWGSQNTCGGPGGPDTNSGSGEAGVSSDCAALGFFGIKAIQIQDWDDGCELVIYRESNCSDEPPLVTYSKTSNWPTEGAATCINDQGTALAEAFNFKYICA